MTLKRWVKRIGKSDRVHAAACRIGVYYIRLVLRTSNMHSRLHPDSLPFFDGTKPVIFAMWHSRILLIHTHAPKTRQMVGLVSAHSDGKAIGRVLAGFGVRSVAGSTSKGGANALRLLVKECKAGNNLAITPDGPRGPAKHASEGIAQLALLTSAPVLCVAYGASRHKTLSSWDKFMVALPFSRLTFVSSAPIMATDYQTDEREDKHKARERLRAEIERTLNEVTDIADNLTNMPAI